jgi:hypothetical protein
MIAERTPRPAPEGDVPADAARDEFIYDAFISYSGFRKAGEASQFDRKVAERLHSSLEAYRVPRALTKRNGARAGALRRLKKIFRDRAEVRASSSLNDSLIESLSRSRFLIVICSPRARQSRWMNQEIATFHSLGRSDHILPLLIEGEPEKAFPEELFRARHGEFDLASDEGARGRWLAQPLAADIRAASVSKSLRLLKEEKIRLIAAILGCEYDDLRRREHERFIRRATSAGAAMLAGLLILATLSLMLYFARQREHRNEQLAVSAAAAILPLTGLEPNRPFGANDPVTREAFAGNAIKYLETIRQDDPENVECLTTLRALYEVRSQLLAERGRGAEARDDFQRAVSMAIPIALSRLRAWRPTEARRGRELSNESLSFPNDYDLNRLHGLLDTMEQSVGADAEWASGYCELVAEYIPLLDTSTPEGRAEARRVLQSGLKKFQDARSLRPLTQPQEELVEAIEMALGRLWAA